MGICKVLKEDTYELLLNWFSFLTAVAVLMHIGCIIFGATWYRFFGVVNRWRLWLNKV
jgi:hypothetical protein